MKKYYNTTSDDEATQRPLTGKVVEARLVGVVRANDENGTYADFYNGSNVQRLYIPKGNVYERPPVPEPRGDEKEWLFLESQIMPLIFRDNLSTVSNVTSIRFNVDFEDTVESSSITQAIVLSVVINYEAYPAPDVSYVITGSEGFTLLTSYSSISFEETSFSDSASTSSNVLGITLVTTLITYDNFEDSMSTSSNVLGITLL